MTTTSFLTRAGARVDQLRELSRLLRSLNWTSATLPDAEHEIPELEVAMTVYRRLNPEGADAADGGDAQAFLSLAESRADHLRQLSQHMHSLDSVHSSLTEIENEIPELELTMTVYRRLTGETDEPRSAAAAAVPAKARAGAGSGWEDEETDAAPVPSFSQFAIQRLDPSGPPPAADAGTDQNGNWDS